MHRPILLLMALAACASARAAPPMPDCGLHSSYDLTLDGDALRFQRAGPAPREVKLAADRLRIDGRAVVLDAADQGRIAAFVRIVHALVPKVRASGRRGVALAADAVRAEAAERGLDDAPFEAELGATERRLDARIRNSRSTLDWRGDAAGQALAGDVAPVLARLAGGLGQQALDAALQGDLQRAAALRDRAASLQSALQSRILVRLQALQPQVQALCPDLQRLDALESGLTLPGGTSLDLLQIER